MPQIPINLTGIKPATGGFDYPPGKYILKTVDVEVKTDNDGTQQYVTVANEIVMGPGTSTEYTGRKIRGRYNLYGEGPRFFLAYLYAVGVSDAMLAGSGGVPQTEWLLEKQFCCDVIKNKGFTNIVNEKPIEELGGAAVAMPSQVAPGPPQQAFSQPPQQQYGQFGGAVPQQQQFVPQNFQQPQYAQYQQQPQQPQYQQQQLQPGMPPSIAQPMPSNMPNAFPAPPPPPDEVK